MIFVQVCTEGRLILEFAFDDLMRIKTWHFTIRQYRELIPRSILAMHVSVTSLTRDEKKTWSAHFRCHFMNPNEGPCSLPRHFLEAIHEHMKFKRQQSSLEGFLQTNLFADIKGHRG